MITLFNMLITWIQVLCLCAVARAASVDNTSGMKYDTIIVGMGAAGSTAASTLAAAGKRVLGLEAQNRIGGRVNTVPCADGVVELGAEWIHGQHPSRTYDLAIKNNISLIEQNLNMTVYRSDGSKANEALINELTEFTLECAESTPGKPEPLGEYLTRRIMDYIKEKYPGLLKDQDFITEFLNFADLVVDNYEATTSWNDVTTATKYKELEGHQHVSWHRHGYKTLFDLLLNTYNNGPGLPTLTIKLNTEVENIKYSEDPNKPVYVTTVDGTVYEADNVIVTVSLGVLKAKHETLFTPGLPLKKITAIEKISMGVEDKIVLFFDNQWFLKENWFSFLWYHKDKVNINKQDVWTSKIVGVSSPAGCNKALTLWTTGETAKMTTLFAPVLPQSKLTAIDKLSIGVKNIFFCRHTTLFAPVLPQSKITAIDKLSIGVMDKIILIFPYRWWSVDTSFYGFLWKGEDKMHVKDNLWITKVFGASSPVGCEKALTVWSSGEAARTIETLPEDLVKRKAMELVRKFMGAGIEIPEPTAMLRSTWHTNPYTRGSYTYDNNDVPNYPTARTDLGAPITDGAGKPKVLFAGEATNPTHFSTVHGAADTGYREAMRLLPSSKI